MAKGSQLTQLKSALSFDSQKNASKKRKRGSVSTEKEKEKRNARLEAINKKMNPFDTKVTKTKFDVGGKQKGIKGNPAKSKLAGIQQRTKTLLTEYQSKDRAGGILDRRFGENDPSMSVEERMLERFTRERQRASKGVAFDLDDGEELTHYGQSLSKLDDFDNTDLGLGEDDEDETGQLDAQSHFGGFGEDEDGNEDEDEGPARKKSKAEVMEEVMAKSKAYKMQRQQDKEKEENVRHELDTAFSSLRDLLLAQPAPPPPASIPDSSTSGSNAIPIARPDEGDPMYDQLVRELAFDKRAKPKDRTKTEEELALEEKEALEKAERRRRKRMLGLDDDEEEEETGKKRRRGADDLDDDFDIEEDFAGVGPGLGDEALDIEESADEEEDEDEEASDDEASAPPARKSKSLAFTFPCPSTHEEFLQIIDGVQDSDVPVVIQRIRTLHHTSLAPENKVKLQGLGTVLIDHILHLASFNTELIPSILPHVLSITEAYPVPIAEYFNSKLSLMHKNLRRGLSVGPLSSSSHTWPSLPELTLLRTIGVIWSTSDLNHAVLNPSRLLIGAYLGLCRVRRVHDIASGLYLCTIILGYEQLSKRYVPEAINFLANALLHLRGSSGHDVPGQFPTPDLGVDLRLEDKGDVDMLAILRDEDGTAGASTLLQVTKDLINRFAELYKGLVAFIEVFTPLSQILKGKNQQLENMIKFSKQSRRPLQLQAHKPIPIATYIPKFSSTSFFNKELPSDEKEMSKLRNQLKQEKKGAIRELRKDSRFLAQVQRKEQQEKDKSYSERMKKVHGSIETERAEEKKMEREKARDKKRSGRK